MRILEINVTCGVGSTGRIAYDLAKKFECKGDQCAVAYGRESIPDDAKRFSRRIGNNLDIFMQVVQTRLLDRHGYGSVIATRKFLKWADEFNPDVLWIHNIHGYYLNFGMLFDWIKSRSAMVVKWTLHDCWAFTGHCGYYTMVKCERWQTGCHHCPNKGIYPESWLIDNSRQNYQKKKAAFSNVQNMTLITPSYWLAQQVKHSFLGDYPVEVHYNTIDTNIFKPTPSDFRKRYGLQGKKVILGVANIWNERKGLDDFIRLASMLDNQYVIVLVGLSDKQIKHLPDGMVGVQRTNTQEELGAAYSTADAFVNPSKKETFGMTTAEAISCGARTVVYEGTACGEVAKKAGGVAVPQSVEALYQAITGHAYRGGKGIASILPLRRTNSACELAGFYTAADVYVNPTYEDNYPTTNLEAQACGTWVITYDTGGAKETLSNTEKER